MKTMQYGIKILALALLLISVLPTGAVPAKAQNQPLTTVPRFEPGSCPFEPQAGQTITCGWLVVPEDHSQPAGKTIRLAVAVLKSRAANPQPDPIIFLAGGPGSQVVASAPQGFAYNDALTASHDLILFDQRGVGRSQPALECPEFGSSVLQGGSFDQRVASGREIVTACRQRLERAGINLAVYNTAQNAADVADLRRALGYDQVNLYGGSYGTRLALTVMRDHPEGIRSVILDSVFPPQKNIYLEHAANFDRAFNMIEQGCASDFPCSIAYPNLRASYESAFSRLNASPLKIETQVDGQTVTMQLDGYLLADLISLLSYNRETIELLPALLDPLGQGDDTTFTTFARSASGSSLISSISYGMFLATECNEEAPFATLEQVKAANAAQSPGMVNSLFGEMGFQMCLAWGMGKPNSIEDQPVISDIPTLILSGQYDPVTPPDWAQAAASTLKNSFFFQFPGLGHGVSDQPCPASIVRAFINAPTVQPDASCITDMRAPQFFVGASGTRPTAQIATLLVLAVALIGIGNLGMTFWRYPVSLAWRASLRHMGWIPIILTIAAALVLLLPEKGMANSPWSDRTRIIESVIPLAMAIQAALLFSPDDEPALEVLLACPRKIAWVLLERLGMVFLAQTGIALVGVAVSLALVGDQDVLVALLRWLPPAIFLSGVGAYVTLRSRVATFGVVVAGLVWFAFGFFGALLLPLVHNQPLFYPLNKIQPFLWIIDTYLQPMDLSMGDYWLNRVFVAAFGIVLLMMTVYQLRDEERVLLGTRVSKVKKGA